MPKFWKWALGIAVVGMLVISVSLSFWRHTITSSVQTELAKIRAAGEPVTTDELSRWPKLVDDKNNAAFIYTNAIEHFDDEQLTNEPYLKMPARRESIPEKDHARVMVLLEDNEAVLKTIEAADGRHESRYPLDYRDGQMMLLPHLSQLKAISRMLNFKALVELENHHPSNAVTAVECSMKVADSLSNEPIYLSQLTRISIMKIGVRTLESVLNKTPLSSGQLSELQGIFSSSEDSALVYLGLVGERAMYNECFQLINDDPQAFIKRFSPRDKNDEGQIPSLPLGPITKKGWHMVGFFERDHAFYLRSMGQVLTLVRSGPPAFLQMKSLNQQFEREARSRFYFLSGLFLQSVSKAALRETEKHAALRTTLASIAIERWRLAHNNTLPETLGNLVPDYLAAVPQDPFDGKPLRYKKLPHGYVVYSVGEDLHDDGGKERVPQTDKTPKDKPDLYDMTFTVER